MTATSTSVGDVIDALLSIAQNSAADGTLVLDGEPNFLPQQNTLLVVVGAQTGETEAGTIEEGPLGDLSMWESYQVACRIEYNGGAVDQKAARDAAIAGYSLFLAAVQADPKLGGAIHQSGFLRPSSFNLSETTPDELSANSRGRRAQIDVTFDVKNLLELS